MKVTLNKTDNVNGIIAIEIEKADYQENVSKSLNKFRSQAQMPGFRAGKVPKSVIQKMYGKSILAEEINKLVSQELFNYIRKNELDILGEPLPNETEQAVIDFDKDENFEFKFDIGLAPEFDVTFTDNEAITFYNVTLEEELLEKQIDSLKQNFGDYKTIEEEALDSDLIKGIITELEDGKAKEEGIVVEDGIIMPSYIKDEETQKKFVGSKVGDIITFNPKTAYDNHTAEIASLLHVTKEDVENIDSEFSFEIKEVTRFEEAELNQELFDKVFGEGNVSSEEEFRTKVSEMVLSQIKPAADTMFMKEARKAILEQMKDIEFPDAFLKRWLVVANENNTKEKIENDYPQISEDLKFHLAKEKLAKGNEIKIENEDLEAFAADVARAQFAQYGMSNIEGEMLDNYVNSLLSDENTARNMYDKLVENKVGEWIKENAKINTQDIPSKELEQLINAENEAAEAELEAEAEAVAEKVEEIVAEETTTAEAPDETEESAPAEEEA